MNKPKQGFKNLYFPILFILLIGGIGVQTLTSCSRSPPPPGSQFNTNISHTSFTDSRDGKTYKIVEIGEQTWMAENLNYYTGVSKCYEDEPDNCKTYGRLYDWQTALNACPSGWHLPSDEEWKALEKAVGGVGEAGKKLKAGSDWRKVNRKVEGSGTDEFGFSALPGGFYGKTDCSIFLLLIKHYYSCDDFRDVGLGGDWWSATENNSSNAWERSIRYTDSSVSRTNNGKGYLYSVRCVQD